MESSPAAMSTRTGAAMQVGAPASSSSSRSRDPRLLGSFDLPASWGYRRPMAFCKDLDALVSGSKPSNAAAAGAAREPRPNGSSLSPTKGTAAQRADEGAAAALESPRQQCYLLRERKAGRDSAEDAREHKMLRNMDSNGGKRSSGFSLQLTKQEIEADFVAITGRKPPRRPSRLSKSVQRQLNPIFPGNLLPEVSRDRYKVNEKAGF